MSRYTLPGLMEAVFLTAEPANLAAPTIAELNAGVSMKQGSNGECIAEMAGWAGSPSVIQTPDYCSHEVGTVPGDTTYPQSSMAIYKDNAASVVYDALLQGAVGWMAIAREGRIAGEESEVFPCTVMSRIRRNARDQAHIYDVNFSIGVPTTGTIAA